MVLNLLASSIRTEASFTCKWKLVVRSEGKGRLLVGIHAVSEGEVLGGGFGSVGDEVGADVGVVVGGVDERLHGQRLSGGEIEEQIKKNYKKQFSF